VASAPRPTPTLRGVAVGVCGAALLVAAAWLGRVDLLFAGLLLTLAPLAAMIAVALDRPWLEVVRSYAPDTITAGQPTQVRLAVRNLAPRPTPALEWLDTLPAGVAPVARRSLPPLAAAGRAAAGGDAAVLRYSARPHRRGAFLLGPLRVTRTDPFGLARCAHLVGESKLLLATPRISALEPGGADEAKGEGSDAELVRHSIPSLDEVIPREYRPGDPLRRVQWRATARLDRLMVRQEEQLSNPQSVILLDTAAADGAQSVVAADGRGHEPFERAVELAASLAVHLLGLGYLVGIHESGERQLSGSYELPSGEQLLIGELAGVRQTAADEGDLAGRLAGSLRAGVASSPTFLLLVDGDPQRWRELAPLRRFAEPAVAFLLGKAAREAREPLEAAGWVCIVPGGATDAAGAWSDAVSARHDRAAGLGGMPRA
jgi:uncharacterized protein (DUF58 family)